MFSLCRLCCLEVGVEDSVGSGVDSGVGVGRGVSVGRGVGVGMGLAKFATYFVMVQ